MTSDETNEAVNGSTEDQNICPEKLNYNIDIWKKLVDMQQHFNIIEMQIRSFAVTVLAGIIAAAGLTLKDPKYITLFGFTLADASFIFVGGIVVLFSFYFMDRFWYHRLLQGAVKAGEDMEEELKVTFPRIILSQRIREESPIRIGNYKIRSDRKIDIFYSIIIIFLLIAAIIISNPGDYSSNGISSHVDEHAGYINISYSSGIKNATEDGIFRGNGSLTVTTSKYSEKIGERDKR